MSGDEGFLTRWSRRKEAARRSEDAPVAVNVPAEAPDEIAAPVAEAEAQVAASPEDDAPIPLEELPPIESIGPETDLTPWLKRNVPPAWRQAALRRLWVSDPGIRDFVGLADYDWDWNTPGRQAGQRPAREGRGRAQAPPRRRRGGSAARRRREGAAGPRLGRSSGRRAGARPVAGAGRGAGCRPVARRTFGGTASSCAGERRSRRFE